ncbi:MAG: DUF3108 domain-containing protein [FCB group bacterium]|nr:DUF3108 domain-containing protein [FCB group bacterium]
MSSFFSFLLIFLIVIPGLPAQDRYQLDFWGIPCGTITLSEPEPGTLTFETQASGLLDWLYPFHNEYTVTFDTNTFFMRSTAKKIRQGEAVEKLSGRWDDAQQAVIYDDKTIIPRDSEVMTVLSMLALIIHCDPEMVDTHWYPMEHEGALYRARFLWAGPDTLTIDRVHVPADRYRLDFELQDDSRKILAHSDFFHEYITTDGLIKQVWVSTKTPKRILQAQVTLSGLTLKARRLP